MEDRSLAIRVREMREANIGNSRDNFSGHQKAFAELVHGDLVGNHAEERRERGRFTANSWLGQLSDRMDLAP